jgi:hypothetical protein
MSLQEQIDALPKWPDPSYYALIIGRDCDDHGWPLTQPAAVLRMECAELTAHAALTRLGLACEWIKNTGHLGWCESCAWTVKDSAPCDCGYDALLAGLELPK